MLDEKSKLRTWIDGRLGEGLGVSSRWIAQFGGLEGGLEGGSSQLNARLNGRYSFGRSADNVPQ